MSKGAKFIRDWEKSYEDLKAAGDLDEIYVLVLASPYVVDAWFKSMKIKKLKPIPDGNAAFALRLERILLDDINADSQKLHRVVSELVIQTVERRERQSAGPTPRRPEIHIRDFPSEVGHRQVALCVLDGWQGPFRRRNRGIDTYNIIFTRGMRAQT